MNLSRAALSVALLCGCAGGSARVPAPTAGAATRLGETPFVVDTVASGLKSPWSLAFLPDGGMLVTEKYGGLRHYTKGDDDASGSVLRLRPRG